MSKRLARLNEQLKRELSELIRTEVRDPRVGVVTISGVETAGDLGSARVFVRAVEDEALPEMLEGLRAAAPFLRSRLGRTLRIRHIPELRFQVDRSLEGARRIEEVLSQVLPADDEDGEDTSE
ncbi:MAG: 30S ribosome-binding factor RbfA [Gemmatimonadota bacterium]|nr:30S ribosome-binding factor RbfA [Gemmatimonadota bacterium]